MVLHHLQQVFKRASKLKKWKAIVFSPKFYSSLSVTQGIYREKHLAEIWDPCNIFCSSHWIGEPCCLNGCSVWHSFSKALSSCTAMCSAWPRTRLGSKRWREMRTTFTMSKFGCVTAVPELGLWIRSELLTYSQDSWLHGVIQSKLWILQKL